MATDVTCLQCGKPYDASVVAHRFAGVCPACLAKFAGDDSGEVEQSSGIADPAMKPPLKLGGTFHGLEIVELLGAGGMGVVYKARQPGLDRFVALKILSPQLSGDPEFVARFNREAKAMAALSHPGIVQVFDFGKEADLCFLVMEFVDGASIRQLIKGRGLSAEQALRIVPKICEALEYAHAKGVIHRDIKPENILVDKEGRVRIADFGLARMLSSDAGGAPVTLSRVVMGTPGYMAPEQYQGMKVDHRADIYSLGAVFYEMLTGDLPVGRFDPPSNKVQIDVRLDEIVLKALATLPERRYQRVGDVKTDVETVSLASRAPLAVVPQDTVSPDPARQLLRWFLLTPLALIIITLLFFAAFAMGRAGILEMVIILGLMFVLLMAFRAIQVWSADWVRGSGRAPGPEVRPAVMRAKRIPETVWLSFIFAGLSYAILLSYLRFGPGGPSFPASEAANATPLVIFFQIAAALSAILALVQIHRRPDRFQGRPAALAGLFILYPPFGLIAGVVALLIPGGALQRKAAPSEAPAIPSPSPGPHRIPPSMEARFESPAMQGAAREGAKPPVSKLAVAALAFTIIGILLLGAALIIPPSMRAQG